MERVDYSKIGEDIEEHSLVQDFIGRLRDPVLEPRRRIEIARVAQEQCARVIFEAATELANARDSGATINRPQVDKAPEQTRGLRFDQ